MWLHGLLVFSFLLLFLRKRLKTATCLFVPSSSVIIMNVSRIFRGGKKRVFFFVSVNGGIEVGWVPFYLAVSRLSSASSPIHSCQSHLFFHWLLNITSVAITGNHTNCLHGKGILRKYYAKLKIHWMWYSSWKQGKPAPSTSQISMDHQQSAPGATATIQPHNTLWNICIKYHLLLFTLTSEDFPSKW